MCLCVSVCVCGGGGGGGGSKSVKAVCQVDEICCAKVFIGA